MRQIFYKIAIFISISLLTVGCIEQESIEATVICDVYGIKVVTTDEDSLDTEEYYGLNIAVYSNAMIKDVEITTPYGGEIINFSSTPNEEENNILYETPLEEMELYPFEDGTYFCNVEAFSIDTFNIVTIDNLYTIYPDVATVFPINRVADTLEVTINPYGKIGIDEYLIRFYNESGAMIFSSEHLPNNTTEVNYTSQSLGWIDNNNIDSISTAKAITLRYEDTNINLKYNVQAITEVEVPIVDL